MTVLEKCDSQTYNIHVCVDYIACNLHLIQVQPHLSFKEIQGQLKWNHMEGCTINDCHVSLTLSVSISPTTSSSSTKSPTPAGHGSKCKQDKREQHEKDIIQCTFKQMFSSKSVIDCKHVTSRLYMNFEITLAYNFT